MASNDEPKRAMGIRLPLSDYEYVKAQADAADVDVSRMMRRMVAFCREHMPVGWLPPPPQNRK